MIDLHLHTTVSDGGDSPSALVEKAAGAGLHTIAVTDHDNDSGCDEAVSAGKATGVDVIRGVEVSCYVEDLAERGFRPRSRPTLHLLAYFVPARSNPLSDALAELRDARSDRNRRMVERLNELGIAITFEEVQAEAGGPGAQIGRPHFANVLVRRGVVPDYQSAFDQYLAKGRKAYMSRRLYKPAEAIELMLAAGAVPVLAHPFTLHLDFDELKRFVDALLDAGLKGVEGYHGDRRAEDQEPIRQLAEAKGLVVSGGSDYHGHLVPDRKLPGGRSGVLVPDEVVDELREVAAALGPA